MHVIILIMTIRILLLFFLILLPETLYAQTPKVQVSTQSGLLQSDKDEHSKECLLKLSGEVISHFDCSFSYTPAILAHYDRNIEPFDDVVFLQENLDGNACDGGPLHVIGLSKSNPPVIFEPIDFCGGANPVLSQKGNEIHILFPGGPLNRGAGTIPDELWILKEGKLSKSK